MSFNNTSFGKEYTQILDIVFYLKGRVAIFWMPSLLLFWIFFINFKPKYSGWSCNLSLPILLKYSLRSRKFSWQVSWRLFYYPLESINNMPASKWVNYILDFFLWKQDTTKQKRMKSIVQTTFGVIMINFKIIERIFWIYITVFI